MVFIVAAQADAPAGKVAMPSAASAKHRAANRDANAGHGERDEYDTQEVNEEPTWEPKQRAAMQIPNDTE